MNKLKNTISTFLKTGFFHIFGSSVVNKIVSFLCSVVIVRILTKEEYGVFTYAWNIYSIVILFNGLGAASAVLQLSSERNSDKHYVKSISNYGFRTGVRFDLVIVATMCLIGSFVPLKIQGAGMLLQMLSFLPVLHLLYDINIAQLRAEKRNKEFSLLNVINTVAVFVGTTIGSLIFREKGMVLGYYFAYLISLFVCYLKLHVNLYSGKAMLSKEDCKTFHSIAIVSMFNTGLSQLMYLLDVFVLGIVDSQETVLASYRVATIIPSALPFITLSLVTYVYPYFAEHRNDKQWCMKAYQRILLGLGAVNLSIVSILFCAAPILVPFLFGQTYSDVVPIFRLLTVNYFFSGTFRILSGNLLVTQRKLKFNLIVAIVAGLINVVADFLFITWWGPMGAAMATVVVVFVTSVLNTWYLICTFRKKEKLF